MRGRVPNLRTLPSLYYVGLIERRERQMTTLAQAFRDGARWRERQANNGIVSDAYLDNQNPYEGTQQPAPSAEHGCAWGLRPSECHACTEDEFPANPTDEAVEGLRQKAGERRC